MIGLRALTVAFGLLVMSAFQATSGDIIGTAGNAFVFGAPAGAEGRHLCLFTAAVRNQL